MGVGLFSKISNLRRFPYLLFWRETCPQTFPLSSCQYVSTIPEKDPQYGENGVRNIYSNYNQMRAYVECPPNQRKNYTLSTSPSSNRRNFEDSGKVLAVSVSEFYESITVQLHQPALRRWLSLLLCVQIDNCFCNTWIVVHQRASRRWFRGTLLSAI